MKGSDWHRSATCVPWYVPRGNTGLSQHGDPVFPHFCPLNQNLARVRMGGGLADSDMGRSWFLLSFACDQNRYY